MIFLMLLLLSCSSDKTIGALELTLVKNGMQFEVLDAKVSQTDLSASAQQGSYQLQLLDKNNRLLKKITFETMGRWGGTSAKFTLKIPYPTNLNQLVIYGMDGSSGHYRVDESQVLLSWTLPDSIRGIRKNP